MTRQELSKLEIRINVVTLWSVIAAVVVAAFVVTSTYKDMMWELKTIKEDIKLLKDERNSRPIH